MPNKLPRSPFATRLSGSARETELRLRNIFQWKKQRPPVVLIILTALTVLLCCGLVSCQPSREEPDAPEDTSSSPQPQAAAEELIASVSLANANPVPVPQMEPETVSADTMGEILCDKALPDGTRVVCYREPGSAYTKYWAIQQGGTLLRFLQEDSAYTEGYDVDTFTDVLGHDGFRIRAPRGAAYYACDYYTLDADGVPRLLAGCANPVLETDADGDGETELICFYHGGQDMIYFFRRDGQVFQAVVTGLLQTQSGIQAWAQEAESWTDGCFPVSWRPYTPDSSSSAASSGFLRFTPDAVALIAAGTGPEPPAQVTAVPAEEWSDAFRAVLLGQAGFFTQDGQSLDIRHLAQAVTFSEGITAEAARFAVLDLDRDGTPEVILWLTAGGNREFAFLILRHQDGGIVSHPEFTRTMGLLKADGTFTFSGGASDWGFGAMKFEDNAWITDRITYCASVYDSDGKYVGQTFVVDHESADDAAFQAAYAQQEAKPDAAWYDFTEDNINAVFSGGQTAESGSETF
ncbi:MAG: hypothetical protein ACI3XJ_05485 [Oscillospiraceae bacterium]